MTKVSGALSVREKCEGGDVADSLSILPDGWLDGTPHIVLLIHGFNNDVDEAREAFSRLTSRLPERFPKVGWFYWPGDADLGWSDFLDFLSYPTEIPDAQNSARHLADTLSHLARENPGVEVTLVGHSLGCRLIAECVLILASRPTERPVIKALLLMAAALPVELAETENPLGQSLRAYAPNGYVFSLGGKTNGERCLRQAGNRSPFVLPKTMPFLWPSPERGNNTAASPVSST